MPAVALWLALLIGLSPTLVDLTRHWLAEPWALPFAVFVPLTILCMLGDQEGSPRRPAGLLLVLAGVLLAAVASASGGSRFGRYGVPAAITGLALWSGWPAPSRALLATWWIPVPHTIQASVFARASALAGWLAGGSPGVEADPASWLRMAAAVLEPADLGLQLAWLLAGLGWYAAASRGGDPRRAAAAAVRAGLLAIPLQLFASAVALALASLGALPLARSWLDAFLSLVAVCASLALLDRGRSNPFRAAPHLMGRGGER